MAGFSGGGKVASHAAVHFANLFVGGLYICGTEPWSGKEPDELARAVSGRYVFMTGTRDFNRISTKQTYEKYIRSGMVNSKLIVESGLAHAMPGVEQFREAVHYLDQRK